MEIRILTGSVDRFNRSDFENEIEGNKLTFVRLTEVLSNIIIKEENEKLTNVFDMDELLTIYSLPEFVDAINNDETIMSVCWTTWFYLKQ